MLLIRRPGAPAAAQRRQRSADVGAEQLVDERKSVALVLAEGKKRDDFRRIGGFLPVLVDRASGRQRLVLTQELLHAAHGDGAGGPVDADREADGVLRRKGPRVWIGSERREFSAERDDLRERRGAGGIRD